MFLVTYADDDNDLNSFSNSKSSRNTDEFIRNATYYTHPWQLMKKTPFQKKTREKNKNNKINKKIYFLCLSRKLFEKNKK